MSNIIITAYTDGACSGNPGPGGWGAIIKNESFCKEIHGGVLETTNNRMELTAAIEALESFSKPMDVNIYTDSTYLQKGISEWIHTWKKRGWTTASKKPVKNKDLWERLDKAILTHTITWLWVKGHSGHPENERADELAQMGLAETR